MSKIPSQGFALITGASAGIGLETARAFARAGFDLVLLARREDRLKRLAEELRDLGRVVRSFAVDLSDASALESWLQSESDLLGQVGVLVNNAGLALGVKGLPEGNPTDWDQMWDVNVRALLRMTHAVLPGMRTRRSGHIVNLGSVAGRWTYPGGAVYCASKAAVKSLSEGLRMDVAGSGIRVTNIEPGMVETEFSVVRLGDEVAAQKVYEGMKPLSAGDIAETILWCVQRPAHVNIQEMVIFPTAQAAVGQVHREK